MIALHIATNKPVLVHNVYDDHNGVRQCVVSEFLADGLDVWKFTIPMSEFRSFIRGVEYTRHYFGKGDPRNDDYRLGALARIEAAEARKAERKAKREAAEIRRAKTGDCPQCGGTGYIPAYSHIHNGECFRCDGMGA